MVTSRARLAGIPKTLRWTAALVGASLTAAGIASTSGEQEADDSAAIREFVQAYQNAWNTRDAVSVAAFFSEDADLVLGNLPAVRGRGAIEGWWRGYFDQQEPERMGAFDVTAMRRLAPEVALVNVATTTGGTAHAGEELPVWKARGTWLLDWQGGRWLIAAMRGLPAEEDRVELVSSLQAAERIRPQIRAFVAAYEEAFNLHDPDALGAFYREDADIVVREQPLVHGDQRIRAMWRDYFRQPRPYRALMIVEEIRVVSDDVALLNIIGAGAPLEATDELAPTRLARATWVLVREEGQWLLAALRVLPSERDRVVRLPR